MANTCFEKEQRKITYGMCGNETEIDFVLVGKNNKKYLKDVKAISWGSQHRLVVTDIDKRGLMKAVKNKQSIRRRVWKLKELVGVDASNPWNTFKNIMLQACDEV